MGLDVKFSDKWNDQFFDDFVEFKNQLYHNHPHHLIERVSDLKKQLESPYFIKQNILFRAVLILLDGNIVGRGLLYYDPNVPKCLRFGYFEVVNEEEVYRELFNEIEKFAREKKAFEIIGPVQGHFFFSYRMKLSGELPFYGEPINPTYYNDIFLKMGMVNKNKWHTSRVDITKTRRNFNEIRDLSKKNQKEYLKLKLKFIFPWRWNKSLKVIYQLFIETYQEMIEYNKIDFTTFKIIYDDFKYIINPFFSYIVEYEGRPVGFCINFFDPLPILIAYEKRAKKKIFKTQIGIFFHKVYLIIRLKFNFRRLLIMYVGKLKKIDGNELKGIQALVSKYLGFMGMLVMMKEAFVCYTSDDSPANKSFKDQFKTVIAEYGLFYKELK